MTSRPDELVVERRVSVPPDRVFVYFTDAKRWLRWQGTDAEVELRPGGVWRVPPGSSTVSIDLLPDGEGTIIRLTHSGLPPDTIEIHRTGWENYVTRLATVGEGRDPGPDPFRKQPRGG